MQVGFEHYLNGICSFIIVLVTFKKYILKASEDQKSEESGTIKIEYLQQKIYIHLNYIA